MTGKVALKAIELSAPDWQQQERTSLQGDPLKILLDWLFESNRLDCAVLAPRSRALQGPSWPRVLLAEYSGTPARGTLEKAARSGFRLVICTRVGHKQLIEFLSRAGYQVSGESIWGSGDEHDPLRPAWNKEVLSQIVAVAARLRGNAICLFGHDADPLYVLSNGDSEHRSE
jgi:hypothetical protein